MLSLPLRPAAGTGQAGVVSLVAIEAIEIVGSDQIAVLLNDHHATFVHGTNKLLALAIKRLDNWIT